MEWLQITVATTSECAELVAMLLSDLGSEGVSVRDDADIRELIEKKLNWDYVDESLLRASEGKALVSGFYAPDFDVKAVYDALDEFKADCVFACGSLEVTAIKLNSSDWENEWRKYYAPIKLGKVEIVPAWQEIPDDGLVHVLIEPGMAFGTGNHETTSMCIELMQGVVNNGDNVLDMGCGSGILGIAAAKLGAKHVVLSDIDPLAITATEENARLNGVQDVCETVCGDLDTADAQADVVIANITADILIRLKEKLNAPLKNNGYLVISGIINARAEQVLDAYTPDFELIKRNQNGEWQAMLLKKRG